MQKIRELLFKILILIFILKFSSISQAASTDGHGTICRVDIKEKMLHKGKCFLESPYEKSYYLSGKTLLRKTGLKGIRVWILEHNKDKALIQVQTSSGEELDWGVAGRSSVRPGCWVGLKNTFRVCALEFRPNLFNSAQ